MEIGLIGPPNVGKSVIFSRLSGVGAMSSNYPGTTVEYQEATVNARGRKISFLDLPGTYSLSGTAEDELVATRLLAARKLDAIIAVVDATRLEQGLVLVFQLIELGFNVIIALNMMDLAKKRFNLDAHKLAAMLDVPVVPTVAVTGEEVDTLIELILARKLRPSKFRVTYDHEIEALLAQLEKREESKAEGFPVRGALLKLLEGNAYFAEQFPEALKEEVKEGRVLFRRQHKEEIEVHIARDRFGEAGRVASAVTEKKVLAPTTSKRISDLTLRPRTGIPILMLVLLGVFLGIVFVGGFLETVLLSAYKALFGGFFIDLANWIGGTSGLAIAQGIDLSLQAILSIVIPYIILFYVMLGILEDTGYLPRVVVLLDGVMHRVGLYGRAIIPMIVGMGCSVPAILATRVMESRKERLLVATITVMAIPCSAQTAVILGTVGNFAGLEWAAAIYIVLLAILLILGKVLHKVLKPEPSILMIEIPDLTVPRWKNVLWKTHIRSKDFFFVAFPILFVGSLVLEFLVHFGILASLVEPLSPFTLGFLGLPPIIIIALIFGILRKEMSMQLLVILFGTANLALVMSPQQLFIFALIMATYLPCLSVFAILAKEFGWKDTMKITLASVILAFGMAGAAHFLFHLL